MPRGARSGPHPSLRIRLHATLRMQRFASGQIGTAATTAHFREIHSFPEGLAVRIGQPIVNCLGDGAWCPVGDSRAQLVELEARCEGPARRLAGVDRLHGLDEPGVERAAPPERRDHLLGECDAAERLGAAHVEQAARTRLDEALRRISQITVVRGRPDLVDRHVHRLAAAQLARQLVHEILADVLRPVHDVGAQNEGGGVSGEHRRFAGELRGPVDVERRRWVLLAVRAARVRRRDAVGLAAAAAGQGRAAREDVVSGVPDDLCADGGRGGGHRGGRARPERADGRHLRQQRVGSLRQPAALGVAPRAGLLLLALGGGGLPAGSKLGPPLAVEPQLRPGAVARAELHKEAPAHRRSVVEGDHAQPARVHRAAAAAAARRRAARRGEVGEGRRRLAAHARRAARPRPPRPPLAVAHPRCCGPALGRAVAVARRVGGRARVVGARGCADGVVGVDRTGGLASLQRADHRRRLASLQRAHDRVPRLVARQRGGDRAGRLASLQRAGDGGLRVGALQRAGSRAGGRPVGTARLAALQRPDAEPRLGPLRRKDV
mmetsp:Transcript_4693/g.14302  ORF Transcript_4693/g.14302 Transcript_4693/m.14302 type:complete len:550 (+) Transcript_4693:118-1767(+)